jgi:hypothetical protein
MVSQDLKAGADDEDQEEQVQEMLNPQPYGQDRADVRGGSGAWMAENERLNVRELAEVLRHGHGHE